MTKRHFIELAETVKRHRPVERPDVTDPTGRSQQWRDEFAQWLIMRDALADFCARQNPRFNRERWLGYINGECGPSGGAVKETRNG